MFSDIYEYENSEQIQQGEIDSEVYTSRNRQETAGCFDYFELEN